MEHPIPAMTNPLGRHWDQPCRYQIEVDDSHALMTVEAFNALSNYSSSYPSGVYEGKMWRRDNFLCWYGESSEPNKCTLNYRKILLV